MAPGYGTPQVAIATTPTVVSTFFHHILSSRSRSKAAKKSLLDGGPGGGPENQLSYEEGLKVVKRFIEYASHHGVEEVQAFTAMAAPVPHWVKRETVVVSPSVIEKAEDILTKHLATYDNGNGLQLVGGSKWWRVRGRELDGEWIEMQRDYHRRTAAQRANATQKSTPESNSTPATRPSSAAPLSHPTGSEPNSASSSNEPSAKSSYLPSLQGAANLSGYVPSASATAAWARSYLPRRQGTTASVTDGTGAQVTSERVILYIHGGAYFFSSLDTHRYQVQRHARKAGGRAFTPAYRLSPQYPFPCGLLDCLASYLFLIDPPPGAHEPIAPTSVIIMGDSAGGGMVVSLLIVIREMGLPMPAGASLISPWVDLTHSMPSIGGWDGGDFIPSSGWIIPNERFHYKPSLAWPPLPGDGVKITMPDGTEKLLDEQIQMYCPNKLLTHPLVSPINVGSLGGLCPLLILCGGAELLRDEIIYSANKAAKPTQYPPSARLLAEYPEQELQVAKYKPTRVHLQVYEGCCHVVPTLSWTRSAKYMYRACANFNIWAYAAAERGVQRKLHHKSSSSGLKSPTRANTQNVNLSSLKFTTAEPAKMTSSPTSSSPAETPLGSAAVSRRGSKIDFTQPIINTKAAQEANQMEMDALDIQSEASTSSDSSSDEMTEGDRLAASKGIVTVNGIEPPFGPDHIVSERVSTHGKIRPFDPNEAIPALDPALKDKIGQINPKGAINKWLAKRAEWDEKYGKDLEKYREIRRSDREKAEKHGFLTRDLQGEHPPLAALAGFYDPALARKVGKSVDEISKRTSGAMLLWNRMSTKADREHAGGDDADEIRKNVEEEIKGEGPNGLRATRSRRASRPPPPEHLKEK